MHGITKCYKDVNFPRIFVNSIHFDKDTKKIFLKLVKLITEAHMENSCENTLREKL